jgi:hypothetical protein
MGLIIGPATVTALKGHWRLIDAGFNTLGSFVDYGFQARPA